MKINYTNKKSVERLLKQPFGYSLFTVSNKEGFKKISLKRNLFKKNYTVTYFNEDVNAIETKEVTIDLACLSDNILSIEGVGSFELQDAKLVLKNPTEQVEKETEIFRQIDRKAREEEITKANKIQEEIIESKDNQIEQIKKEAEQEKTYYTTGRVNRLKNIMNEVLSTRIYHDSYSYRQVYNRIEGYHMESSTDNYDYEEKRDLSFLLERIENISKTYKCDAFEDNRIRVLISKIKEKFASINEYDEKTLNSIQALYGLLAEELTMRTYNLCNFIRENDIDTSKYTYRNVLYSNSSKYYEEESEFTDTEVITDYFNKVMEAVSVFVERVTGQDIRKEIELRLTKQQIIIPILMKTTK